MPCVMPTCILYYIVILCTIISKSTKICRVCKSNTMYQGGRYSNIEEYENLQVRVYGSYYRKVRNVQVYVRSICLVKSYTQVSKCQTTATFVQ